MRRCPLSEPVMHIMAQLASFFGLCVRRCLMSQTEFERAPNLVVMTLCKMEIYLSPAFFTVMVHLIVNLVNEVKLGGPVQPRWMYPFERYYGMKMYINMFFS